MEIPVYQLRKTEQLEYYMYCFKSIDIEKDIVANQADIIVDLIKSEFDVHKLAEEEVYALYLNHNLCIKAIVRISHGTENMSMVCNKSLFRQAFLCNASGIILVHNHPSGNTNPSKDDIRLTEKLKDCCALLGLELFDHIIIGSDFTSLRSKGLI